MFTAYSAQGQLKPRLILAEGFWDGLIQAAAYLGCESVRINALKYCPWLAEAVNDIHFMIHFLMIRYISQYRFLDMIHNTIHHYIQLTSDVILLNCFEIIYSPTREDIF